MSAKNISAVDLNLLHVVATVLEQGSATRAAAMLHVTQSAVSNALARARALFDDPLVVRQAHGLVPTPRAAAMLPALRAWIEEARRLITDAPTFDAARSERTFTMACSDAVALVVLQPLLRLLRRRAPNAKLRILTIERMIVEDALARGEADVLVGMPPTVPPGQVSELLYRDPMVCIVRKGQVRGKKLGRALYAALPHVEVALFGAPDSSVDRALRRRGSARVVRVAVPHFSTVPLAVLETGGTATLARRLAIQFASRYPLDVLDPPVRFEPLKIHQVWHRRSESDAAACFFRDLVRETTKA